MTHLWVRAGAAIMNNGSASRHKGKTLLAADLRVTVEDSATAPGSTAIAPRRV
jgi:hypothetical protein